MYILLQKLKFFVLYSVMALAAADGGHGGHGGGHGGHGGYGQEVYAHTPPHYSYKVTIEYNHIYRDMKVGLFGEKKSDL